MKIIKITENHGLQTDTQKEETEHAWYTCIMLKMRVSWDITFPHSKIFFVVCESGLKFLSGDRALLRYSPAIPCQFPRQMAIDGPEWGKCLVNKASRRYSAGFRELNSLPHTPCSNFYFQSFFILLIYLYLHLKSGLLLRLPARLCFFFLNFLLR